MKRRHRPAFALAVFACMSAAGCQKEHTKQKRPHSVSPDGVVTLESESRQYIHVEPAGTPPPSVERTLFARVAFDEKKVAAVGSPVSGRIIKVHVVTGAKVAAGEPLLTIHSSDVAAARAQVAQSRQARMLAEQAAARAGLLVRQGAGSVAEQQQAETSLAQARAEERRTSQVLGGLGAPESGSDYVLRSPIAGVVVERSAQPGNAVAGDQGQPLVTVADLSSVWVLADVYEHDVGYIRIGDNARVIVPALEGKAFTGRVAYIGDVVDATTRAARARIELTNETLELRPGMFVEVEVQSPEAASAFVPVSAVLARRDEYYVFVPTGPNAFTRRAVQVGPQVGDHIAILNGVKAGESLVTRGAILLDAEANAAL